MRTARASSFALLLTAAVACGGDLAGPELASQDTALSAGSAPDTCGKGVSADAFEHSDGRACGTRRRTHRLLFKADDGVHGLELWVTGGTAATTHMVADFNPNASDFDWAACQEQLPIWECEWLREECGYSPGEYCRETGSQANSFTAYGGETYFVCNDGAHGLELCRTDGFRVERLTDINPNGHSFFSGRDADPDEVGFQLIAFDGALYLRATDGTRGGPFDLEQFGLYRYTPGGGLEHIRPAAENGHGNVEGWFASMGGRLYFVARRLSDGNDEVFAYTPGQDPVALGLPYPQDGWVHTLVATSDALLFNGLYDGVYTVYGYRADTGLNLLVYPDVIGPLIYPVVWRDEVCSILGWTTPGGSLWCHDGSPGGSYEVGPDDIYGSTNLVAVGDSLYFSAASISEQAAGIWVTDGLTPAQLLYSGGGGPVLEAHAGTVYYECWLGDAYGLCRKGEGGQEVVDQPGWAVGDLRSIPDTSLLAYSAAAPGGFHAQLRVFDAATGLVEHIPINPNADAHIRSFFAIEPWNGHWRR